MPYRASSADAHWRERWHEPWDDGRFEHQPPWRMSQRAKLWMPVVVSFIVQVPAVFLRWHVGEGPSGPAGWPDRGALLALAIALIGPLALIGARRFPGPVVAITAAAGSADLLLVSDSLHPPYIALAFAIVSAIVRGARVWAWISVSAVWVATLIVAIVFGLSLSPPRIAAITLGILIVMGIGEGIRTRRERFRELSPAASPSEGNPRCRPSACASLANFTTCSPIRSARSTCRPGWGSTSWTSSRTRPGRLSRASRRRARPRSTKCAPCSASCGQRAEQTRGLPSSPSPT